LPPELEAFWERACTRDRELRFQSAKELSDALAATAMLERREVPTLPPRTSLSNLSEAEQASLPPLSHNIGRSKLGSFSSTPNLSDASETDFGTDAPLSRTRRSVLPTLSELTPRQRKVAVISGVAAIALIGFGVSLALTSGTQGHGRAAGEGAAEAPVTEPAAPPVPAAMPRLAEAPPSPLPPVSSAAPDHSAADEQKKKDKKKRVGVSAPAAPANPDYGI
jgi:hypothetical protein